VKPADAMELLVYPAIFMLWKERELPEAQALLLATPEATA
jgi:hypothetical protein